MLFIIVAVIWFCVRKKERIRRRAEYLMLIPVAYGLGHLCVLGFRTVSYSEWRDFQLILAIGILLYCAMLLALNIFYAGMSLDLGGYTNDSRARHPAISWHHKMLQRL